MKLTLFKDKEEFHAWQFANSKGLDDHGQTAISVMAFPVEYPAVMVWDIREEADFDIDSHRPNVVMDVLHYKYVYIGHFPVRNIKRGTYVYQVFQTGDGE